MSVPVYNYQTSEKLDKLSSEFSSRFGANPSFYVKAPGRVNLIGEHIDYCGYGVCPMALELDVVMAVSTTESQKMSIFNVDGTKYPDFSADTSDLKIDLSEPRWYNYVLCGIIGMTQHLGLNQLKKGYNIMVHGTIPPSAGLSSSSALVCAAAVVIYKGEATEELTANQLAEMCAQFERLIGTQGGGMDQAASFLSKEGSACAIDFDPLRISSVVLPRGVSFVVANSGVQMNKSATAHFNTRVNECRLACMIMARKMGLEWQNILKLGKLQEKLDYSLQEMLDLVEKELKTSAYSQTDVAAELGVTENVIADEILTANVRHVNEFNLYSRAKHVYGEALRVKNFVDACSTLKTGENESVAHKLGDLMNGSHYSCSVLYDCSCPMLDKLVEVCRNSGALGSRLTGAGWGGCSVSLVETEKVDGFMEKVKKEYYDANDLDYDIFVTVPSAGVSIILGD